MHLDLSTISTLRANQRTLIAPLANGQIYFLQPDDGGTGVVQVATPDGQSGASRVTPARICETLNQPKAFGSIRAMVALPANRLLIYFQGTTKTESLTSILIYDASADTLTVFATPTVLGQASGLGLQIDLANAQLTIADDVAWLWLRHPDGNVFLSMDIRDLVGKSARFTKRFGKVFGENGELRLSDADSFFGDLTGKLWLIQSESSTLWRLATDGTAIEQRPPINRPKMSVAPLRLRRDASGGRATTLQFYPTEQTRSVDEPSGLVDTQAIHFPAFELLGGKEEFLRDRDFILIRQGFPLHALRLTNWVIDPNTDEPIAYDRMSGELFRIKFIYQ